MANAVSKLNLIYKKESIIGIILLKFWVEVLSQVVDRSSKSEEESIFGRNKFKYILKENSIK